MQTAFALGALCLLAGGGLALTCSVTDKVSLQLNWSWQAQFAGFQAASSMGYYADECLGVQIRQGDPTFDGLSEVSEGRAVLGNSWTSKVVNAHSGGSNVTVIMQHFQRTGSRLVTELRGDIQDFRDLDNKSVSLFVGSLNDMSARAAITKYGMHNVTIRQQGFTPYKLFATDDSRVAAVSVLVYNELAQLYEVVNPNTGVLFQPSELNIFDFEDLGTAMLEDNVFASSEWLAVPYNQNITRRFLRATARGWMYCRDHELECVNMFSDHGPHQLWMMREVNRLVWPSQLGVGNIDPVALAKTVAVLNDTNSLAANPSSSPMSDNSYMQWALASLAGDHDIYGLNWTAPSLHFCQNPGQSTFHVCTEVEATVCPPGTEPQSAGICTPCPPGSFSGTMGTGNACAPCAPGTYSSATSQLSSSAADQPGAIVCLGCPAGTRTAPDGRLVCGKAGFEDTIMDLFRSNVVLISVWLGAIFITGVAYFWAKRKYPLAHVQVIPNAVGAVIELILDIMFIRLLVQDPHPYYFAVAITAFSVQLALQVGIVILFLYYELQQSSVRRWAEANSSALPPVLMISVLNPELVEILASKIGETLTYTQAPFSPKGCAALRFCTFAAFIVGRSPQVCIEILILQRDGWHLSPFLASITNLALLARGTVHYLLLNTLFLYKRRAGGHADGDSRGVSGLFGLSVIDGITSLAGHGLSIDRLKAELQSARQRVRHLEMRLGEHKTGLSAQNISAAGPAGSQVLASNVLTDTDRSGIAFHRISNPTDEMLEDLEGGGP
ncbi:hypothetical protein HDU88_006141 [Geranomyces variabilis]|nr:hypothetical protein HDU88_006141 [Geranomyces variabilis]